MATPSSSINLGNGGDGGSLGSFRRRRTLTATDNSMLVQQAKATTIVAIDVGTYGSGFAYVISRPGEVSQPCVKLHTEWPDRPAASPSPGSGGSSASTAGSAFEPSLYPKTRSALLLRGGKGVAFGWTAVRLYCDMDEQERTDGRYCLLYGTEFKLGLHDPSRVRRGSLPEGIAPEDAFSEFLRLIKIYILANLKNAGQAVGSAAAAAAASASATARGMVRWCLTVPAMWNDEAKAKVRRAAHRAGLITQLDSDELTVVLEPEAAALQLSIGTDRPTLFPAALATPLATAASRAAPATPGGSGTRAASPSQPGFGAHVSGSGAAAPLRPGEVFMVVDAGGGTVDITIHEVEERSGTAVLSEAQAVPGLGEMWGATAIDSAFQQHFRSKVGEEVFDVWLAAHAGEWVQLLEGHWEPIKCRFDGEHDEPSDDLAPAGARESGGLPDGKEQQQQQQEQDDDDDDDWAGGGGGTAGGRRKTTTWRVPIPPTLHATMDAGVKAELLMDHGLDDSVVLDRRTLAKLFRNPVNGVLQAACRQLDTLAAAPRASASRCNKVLLAGGFGCSRYLQSELAAALGGRLTPGGGVLVPEHPAAAVLQGAALYGLKPELVHARASRLTYGVRTAVPYEDGMPAKFWHSADFCYYSAAGFSPFVVRGQLVAADEVVTHVFTPLSPEQQIASVELWATDKQDVRWIEAEDITAGPGGEARTGLEAGGGGGSMRRVGEVQVFLLRDESLREVPVDMSAGGSGDSGDVEERLIMVSLEFGRTEIRVTAHDMSTGRDYKTRVKFAFS